MNKFSKKTAAENRKLGPERRDYVESHWCVLSQLPATDVHEIEGGSFRQRTKKDKRYWLAVSRLKHDELQYMPKPRQWLLKCIHDPENFSIEAMGELPGRVTTAAEVLEEFRKFYLELRH